MKIDFSSATQQTKTELDEKFFSIADPAFIFDLLRNKIYSNPILAVCRELSCNALDANRESGNGDVPVQITLPTFTDPYFKVKDSGPGISPERMDDIYLKYAASTKRDSNDQIGAFGIGAKSPFSYSESFTIVTNVNGKCYNYMAFIDESRIGKLITLSETDTDEPNGTEVIVPVKQADFTNFASAAEQATRHWKVKPETFGNKLIWRNVSPTIGTTDWFVSTDRESYYDKRVKVLVGETEYGLDSNAASAFADLSILKSINSDIYLCFNVGEVSLAANRESIYLDVATKEAIKNKLLLVNSQYRQLIQDKIDSFPSYWDACCFYGKELSAICRDISSIPDLNWSGKKLQDQIFAGDTYTVYEFYKRSSRYTYGSEKIHRRQAHTIPFDNRSKILIHDCGTAEPNSRHVKNFFEDYPECKSFYVIHPKDANKEDFDLDYFLETDGFADFPHELLSKHNKAIKAKKKSDKAKMIFYKYEKSAGNFAVCTLAEVKGDTNKKLFTYLHKDTWRNRKYPINKETGVGIANTSLNAALLLEENVSIYATDENVDLSRVRSVLSEINFVDNYINNYIGNVNNDFYYETLWALEQKQYFHYPLVSENICSGIIHSESLLLKLRDYQNGIISMLDERAGYIKLLDSLNKKYCSDPEFESYKASRGDLAALWKQAYQQYPLLEMINNWRYADASAHIVEYINLLDRQKLSN